MAPSALSLHPFLSLHGCLPHYPRLHGRILTTDCVATCFLSQRLCQITLHHGSFLTVPLLMAGTYSLSPRGGPAPSLAAHPNADPELPMCPHIWPLLQYATFASSPITFTIFWLPCLVRARVPHDTGASISLLYKGPLHHPPRTTTSQVITHSESHICLLPRVVAQLSTCHCYEKYLPSPIPFSHPSTMGCGEYALLFWGILHSAWCYRTTCINKNKTSFPKLLSVRRSGLLKDV